MKKLFLFLIVAITAFTTARAQGEFITVWDTNIPGAPSSNNTTIYYPGNPFNPGMDGAYNLRVEDMSGNLVQVITNIANFPHPITVSAAGQYRIKASSGSGTFNSFGYQFSDPFEDGKKLINVEQWGNIQWKTMNNTFYSCENMDVTATDIPDFSQVTEFVGMFSHSTNLVGNATFNQWDVSSAIYMQEMFLNCPKFNQPIGNWNTANVENMERMFSEAAAFNQPIGNWNTANVASMLQMFYNCAAFNQPLTNWNTAKVEFIGEMFSGARAFNQSLANFDLSGLSTDPNLEFPNTELLTNTALDCANYAKTLMAWAAASGTPKGLQLLGAATLQYGSQAQAAHDYLVNTKGWTITDAGPVECAALPVSFGPVSATIANGQLLVHWSTLTETNNDHFIIEASKDGKTFTKLSEVKSKAVNGNSNAELTYNYATPLGAATSVLGALAFIGIGLAGFSTKKKLLLAATTVAVIAFTYSCSKKDMPAADAQQKIWVRIAQVDKDGTTKYSKAVEAVRE